MTRRRGSLSAALESTIRELRPAEVDSALVKLAERYAQDIDEASVVAASLTKVLREVAALDVDLHDRLLPLAVRIERTAVLASIGPKLQAALDALGATPRARSAVLKGGVTGDQRGGTKLDELRARRARTD